MLKLRKLLLGTVVQPGCWTVLVRRRDPRLAIRQHHSPL